MASIPRLYSGLALAMLVLLCFVPELIGASDIVAAGASFPKRLYDSLAFAFVSELPQYSLKYTSLGSSKGKCRIMDYYTRCDSQDVDQPFQIDWAGTDSIHKASDYNATTGFPDLQMFPAVAGAAVAAFNLAGVDDLILPLEVLADIFRKCDPAATCPPGWISHWNHTRIVAANPHISQSVLEAAGEIQVVVRADGSGTTEIFKQALASVSTDFVQQIGASKLTESSDWKDCQVLRGYTNRGVAAKVLNTPGSIGYISLDEARSSGLKFAGIGKSVLETDRVLRANAKSIEYALLERGFSFGNNGDAVEHLTASVMGASGSEAWPIVGYTYFSVRLNTSIRTNGGMPCDLRKAVLHWFEWFYSSETAVDIATNQGFAVLPAEGRTYILQRIRSQFRCNGKLVYTSPDDFPVADSSQERVVNVNVRVPQEILSVVGLYADAYRAGESGFAKINSLTHNADDDLFTTSASTLANPATREVTAIGDTVSTASAAAAVAATQDIVVVDSLSLASFVSTTDRSLLFLPFAAMPWGITYNFCEVANQTSCAFRDLDLVLTPELAIQLLSGEIEYWNDTRIKQLQASTLQADLLPFLPVSVVTYESDAREKSVFERLVQLRLGRVWNASSALPFAVETSNYEEAGRLVAALRGGITFGPVNRNMDTTLARVARMKDQDDGTVSTGNVASVISCVDIQSSDIIARYNLTHSGASNCWPFTNSYFVAIPKEFSSDECLNRGAQESAAFVAFLLQAHNTSVEDPLSLVGMAKLDDNSSLDNLAELQCFGRSITRAEVDMQLVPEGLIWASRAMAILMIFMILLLALWIFINRFEPVLRASSPIFMWQMCLGFILELCAVFALTMQDGPAPLSALELNAACMAAPWLYVVGFTLVYGSLLAKTYRIYKIFNNPAMRRIHITAFYLTRLEIVMSVPIIIVMIIWTVVDPFRWQRTIATVDPTTGVTVSTKGECVSNHLIRYLVPIMVIFAVYILSGLILAWKNRDTPTEFSEGRYVTGAIMTDTELLIIGVPILIITSSNPVAAFVVKVLFVFLSVGATVVVFFYPKFAILSGFWSTDSTSGTNLLRGGKAVRDGSNKDYRASRQPTPRNNNHSGSSMQGSGGRTGRAASFVQSVNETLFRSSSMENVKHQAMPYANKKQGSFFSFSNHGTLFEEDEPPSTGALNRRSKPLTVHTGAGGNIVLSLSGPVDFAPAPSPSPSPSPTASAASNTNGSFADLTPHHSGDDVHHHSSSKESVDDGGATATMFFGKSLFVSSSQDLTAVSRRN